MNELFELPQTVCTDEHIRYFDFTKRVYVHYDRFKDLVEKEKPVPHPPPTADWFLLTSAGRVEVAFLGALRLCAYGHQDDARVVLRTMFECLFYIGYFLIDTQKHSVDWAKYYPIYQLNSLKKALRLGTARSHLAPQLDTFVMNNRSAIDYFTTKKSQAEPDPLKRQYYDNWTRKNISYIAKKAGMSDDYRSFYVSFSEQVHTTFETWNGYYRADEKGNLVGLGPMLSADKKDVLEVVCAGCNCLLRLIETLNIYYKIDLPTSHSDLCDKLGNLWTELAGL